MWFEKLVFRSEEIESKMCEENFTVTWNTAGKQYDWMEWMNDWLNGLCNLTSGITSWINSTKFTCGHTTMGKLHIFPFNDTEQPHHLSHCMHTCESTWTEPKTKQKAWMTRLIAFGYKSQGRWMIHQEIPTWISPHFEQVSVLTLPSFPSFCHDILWSQSILTLTSNHC